MFTCLHGGVNLLHDPGAGGGEGEGDEGQHEGAGLAHRAPRLGRHGVAHEDVTLHRQGWTHKYILYYS